MDPDADRALIWIAEAGLKAPLPRNWRPCRSADGEIFYFNCSTGQSVWGHPCDEQFRELFRIHKLARAPQAPAEPRAAKGPGYRHRLCQDIALSRGGQQVLPARIPGADLREEAPAGAPAPSGRPAPAGLALPEPEAP